MHNTAKHNYPGSVTNCNILPGNEVAYSSSTMLQSLHGAMSRPHHLCQFPVATSGLTSLGFSFH